MDLADRAKKIIMTPATEWEVIKGESLSINDMYRQYALILAIIPAAAGFIGQWLVGTSIMGINTRVSFFDGLTWAALAYVVSLLGVYILAYIIDALAPTFGCQKDMNASMKIAVFSTTASWVAGVLTILPALSVLSTLAGLYSFYLMFIGLRTIKEVPPEKLVGYFVVTVVIAIIAYIILGTLVAAFTMGGYMASP